MRRATELVLRVLLHDPTRPLYNRQIAKTVDLDAGTTHDILGRLVEAGHAESWLEDPGKVRGRPRRFYRLTVTGRRWAAATVGPLPTITLGEPADPSGADPKDDVLYVPDVADMLGVGYQTIWLYLRESVAGRYAAHPFPAEDGRNRAGRYWRPDRATELRAWHGTRRDG